MRLKESEAVNHLRILMQSLQKYRSNTIEETGLPEEFLAEMWPWVFGDRCPLPALVKILNRVEEGHGLVPLDYYNMMVALHRFMPEVASFCMMEDGFPRSFPNHFHLVVEGWDKE